MPNWCNNNLTLTHSDPDMIRRAAEAFNNGTLLNEFIPIPEELMTGEEDFADSEASQARIAKYGYRSWYDYCVNEWGTKWDISPYSQITSEDATQMECSFDTAWSPPIQAYEKLVELGFEVSALYYEPGMNFCGGFETEFGDNYYDIPGTVDAVYDQIPSEIEQAFNIAENVGGYEDEENEEE